MPSAESSETQIRAFYAALTQACGPQHWWPAQGRFEVIVGAFLTQNTSWINVERAISNLRHARALSIAALRRLPLAELEKLIYPAGYFRQKARRLKTFVAFLDTRYGGSLERMFAQPTAALREELLALNGIGPETADSILLYAGNHPVFVVDAYTRRIVQRHRFLPPNAGYEQIRELFERALRKTPPAENPGSAAQQPSLARLAHHPSRMSKAERSLVAQVFNDMHALLVVVGKNYCFKKAPKCEGCPLQPFLPCRSGTAQP
ncbi:MAG: endonuclease III domain-containing protein [Terriglobales bacterium]